MSENELPEGAIPLADSLALASSPSDNANFKLKYQPAQPIVIELADGRKVGMARPKMSLSMFISGVLANVDYKNPQTFEMERNRVKIIALYHGY